MQTRITIGLAVCVAGTGLVGCANEKPKSFSGPLAGFSVLNLDVPTISPLAKAAQVVYPQSTPPYKGQLTLRPAQCSTPNDDGAEMVLEYKYQINGPQVTEWAFIAHPTKGSIGDIVPAVDGEDPFCADGEPVYKLSSGAVVLTGTRPVTRGPRGRAGAPGTWIAIAIDSASGTEYHYLVSTNATHKLVVRTFDDYGVPIGAAELTQAESVTQYIEVKANGQVSELPLVVTTSTGTDTTREDQRDELQKLAGDCKQQEFTINQQIARELWKLDTARMKGPLPKR